MVQLHLQVDEGRDAVDEKEKKPKFYMNDHTDLMVEILQNLDGRSLSVAACVCKLWCSIARNDSLWEHLCFRNHVSPPSESVKTVVVALGGYKSLYMVCVRPVLNRLGKTRLLRQKCGGGGELDSELARGRWTRHELELSLSLSLSLFCVDYYEKRQLLSGGGHVGQAAVDSSSQSLMFLCKPVNV